MYQLRVVRRGVSSLIWRRVLVRSDMTIADLHATLQTALGWGDEHLNRFVIRGHEYGVTHAGGIGFRDDPRLVRLVDLGLRVGERLLYEYDFTEDGSTTCASNASCRSSRRDFTWCAWAAAAPYRTRTAVGRVCSRSCASVTRSSAARIASSSWPIRAVPMGRSVH